MSMTSHRQDAEEVSHTAWVRSKLLQQMQPSPGLATQQSTDGGASWDLPKYRSGGGVNDSSCWGHPVRGSGHHQYLPLAGVTQLAY